MQTHAPPQMMGDYNNREGFLSLAIDRCHRIFLSKLSFSTSSSSETRSLITLFSFFNCLFFFLAALVLRLLHTCIPPSITLPSARLSNAREVAFLHRRLVFCIAAPKHIFCAMVHRFITAAMAAMAMVLTLVLAQEKVVCGGGTLCPEATPCCSRTREFRCPCFP